MHKQIKDLIEPNFDDNFANKLNLAANCDNISFKINVLDLILEYRHKDETTLLAEIDKLKLEYKKALKLYENAK
jgi:hypothetical protein